MLFLKWLQIIKHKLLQIRLHSTTYQVKILFIPLSIDFKPTIILILLLHVLLVCVGQTNRLEGGWGVG